MFRIKTSSAQETMNVGRQLGKILNKGDVICLTGGLGVGKTAFTSGIASSLGIEGYITSPTFTIVNEYTGKITLYHFDVYRIADIEEMFDIGYEEYIDGNGIVVIEWADLIKEILPVDTIVVNIDKDISSGTDNRIIDIMFIGDKYSSYERKFENESTGC